MRTVRAAVAVAGAAAALWGVWKLTAYSLPELSAVALWLAGGVVAHDALVVPLTLALALVARLLPLPWRAPAAVGLIVLAPVTLLAIPVLGRFGARDDNLTLLDRNYWIGWVVLAVVTVAVCLLAGRRRQRVDRLATPCEGVPSERHVG